MKQLCSDTVVECVHTCLLLRVPIQAFLETVKSQSTILDLAVTSTGEL